MKKIITLCLLGICLNAVAQFPERFNVDQLNGNNGYSVSGLNDFDLFGFAVSTVGDINHDGVDDLAIGAYLADANKVNNAGQLYVIFGVEAFKQASFDLNSLDGSNGFVLQGNQRDQLVGLTVSSAGDINADGIDDLIVGSLNTRFNGGAFVIYGKTGSFDAVIQLAELDGENGFTIQSESGTTGSGFGRSVSTAGDLNNDGIDDIMINEVRDPIDGTDPGIVYVVYGRKEPFPAVFSVVNMPQASGFSFNGEAKSDRVGRRIGNLGDVNGDGIDDIIAGADGGDPNGNLSGKAYVIYGQDGDLPSNVELSTLDGTNGFVVHGKNPESRTGFSVNSAGDVNGDGLTDILIGAFAASGNMEEEEVHVIFGNAKGFVSPFELSALDGLNGFVIRNSSLTDRFGASVDTVGDVNDDGFDDFLIGSSQSITDGQRAGKGVLIYGSGDSFPKVIDTQSIGGVRGFTLYSSVGDGSLGSGVGAAGDFNNDGVADLIIGAESADSGLQSNGAAYIVYGKSEIIFTDGFEQQNSTK